MIDNSTTSAIISGGTQGLGMAVAECLISQGCRHLTITGRDTDKGEAAAATLGRNGVECLFVPVMLPASGLPVGCRTGVGTSWLC